MTADLRTARRSLHGVAELVLAGPQYRRSGTIRLRVSPGDSHLDEPYAYAGPWEPRQGAFWNASFGATRPLRLLPGATALFDFFMEARDRAARDRPRGPR